MGLLAAAPDCCRREDVYSQEHPFFRRYGIILPSSLTRVRSSALVCSTYPPVSVSGTGVGALPPRPFVAVQVSGTCRTLAGPARARFSVSAWGLPRLPTSLNDPRLVAPGPPRHLAWVKRCFNGAGISTCCPSPTPCGLGLGPTHPLRIDRAAEPLDIRRWGFSPHESLLIPTFALAFAPHGLPLMVLCSATLPYH